MAGVGPYDILDFLSRAGKLGFPFSNMAHNDLYETDPGAYLETLRALENKGFIKFRGPRTLDDFAGLIEEKSAALVPAEEQDGQKKDNHHHLFSEDHAFFSTSIRPTLRGLMALGVHKAMNSEKIAGTLALETDAAPPVDPAQALQQLLEKRQAEKEAAEAARPMNAYENVIAALTRGDDKDPKEWGYATQYWKDDEWAALAAHKRLMESNSVYGKAFESFVAISNKFMARLEKQEDHLVEGSLSSRIVENPYSRVLLAGLFNALVHLPSALTASKDHKTMQSIYLADRAKSTAPASNPQP